MNHCFTRLPRHIYGLWVLSGASIVVAIFSIAQAHRRPVSAISGIAPYSDILEVVSGRVLRPPTGPHATVDLRVGDQLLRLGSRTWEHAQRVNLHELPDQSVGTSFPLLVQRGNASFAIDLPLRSPTPWEQLLHARFGLAALVLGAAPTALLLTLTRALLHNAAIVRVHSLETRAVSAWCLIWQTAAIVQSCAGLKYPVAVVWVDMLVSVLALAIGASSLPFPFAPPMLCPRWLQWVFRASAGAVAVAILTHAWTSPFEEADWRRGVQLLRPADELWHVAIVLTAVGAGAAIVGITLTATSRALVRYGHALAQHTSGTSARILKQFADWMEATYGPVPTNIRAVTELQLAVLLIYVLLDLLPRMLGGVGGGYSVLLGLIPLSYIALYGDRTTQARAHWLIRASGGGALILECLNVMYRGITGTYTLNTNAFDRITLGGLALSSIGGGFVLALDQWWRGRRTPTIDPAQTALDQLFTQLTQAAWWSHLVKRVGPTLGVDGWMWLQQRSDTVWHCVQATAGTRTAWLADPAMVRALDTLAFDQPASVWVDVLALPSTLVLLPVYHSDQQRDVLIATNPQAPHGNADVEHPLVYARLMQAVGALRSREHALDLARALQALAEQRGELIGIMRTLAQTERRHTFQENLRFSALLHDRAMQQVALIVGRAQQHQHTVVDAAQRAAWQELERDGRHLDEELRRVARALQPPGYGNDLRYTLEYAVMEWEQHHSHITFDYTFAAQEEWLDAFERESIFIIVEQLVANALKHAAPTTIVINVYQTTTALLVSVHDDGKGFDYDPARIRPDALGIQQRYMIAADLGGTLTITTRPEAGCQVVLHVPLPPAEA